jgi:HSP20 family protein
MGTKDPIRPLRSELERGISRVWAVLIKGWHELLARSHGALTQFVRPGRHKRWSLLAADAWETAHAVIIQLELPGLKREDIHFSIHRGTLKVYGEKRATEELPQGAYRLMQRAFGRFERRIALPHNVDSNNAELSYQDGVLTIIVPKTEPSPPRGA